MTSFEVFGTKHDPLGFELCGHAGESYSQENSLACASISLLATTIINSLETIAKLDCIILIDEENARMSVKLPKTMTDKQKSDSQLILKVLIQGIEDIKAQYPNAISIIKCWNRR